MQSFLFAIVFVLGYNTFMDKNESNKCSQIERCFDCPRMCGVQRDRSAGFCGETSKIRVAKVIENFMWEEPLVTGKKGTLAIFFSGCSLRCQFCQNFEISHIGKGDLYTPDEFAAFLKSFDYSKFDSVDFITPTHFSSSLLEALKIYKPPVPLVWNSSGYENVEILDRLKNFVDVYLFDLKFFSPKLSKRLAFAENYFEKAIKAIEFAIKAKKDRISKGVIRQGVIVRHLVLPDEIEDSFKLLDALSALGKPYISLMRQFTPTGRGEKNRVLKPIEFKAVLAHAQRLGFKKGFYQEAGCAEQSFIPRF